MTKPPTPLQCEQAAKALRQAAAYEHEDGDTHRASLLNDAAEIMEAKALVGAIEIAVLGKSRKGGPR